MAKHIEIGKKGEELAVTYLKSKGYKILELNYRVRRLEVDIIAIDGDELVIIEVKTRQNPHLSDPEFTVSQSKQNFLIEVAETFVLEREMDQEVRFDIVSVIMNRENPEIKHIKGAFMPE